MQGKYYIREKKKHFDFRAMLSYGKHERNQIYVPFKILEQLAFMYKRLILALLSPGAS